MRRIPIKNYIILLFIIIGVVVVTFGLRNFYNNSLRQTSVLYKYAKHMNSKELSAYLSENSSVIIYISDKYDLNKDDIENKIKSKIINHNLYNNFVYIDKRDFDSEYLLIFNNNYHTNINTDKLPTLIIYDDGSIADIYYSVDNSIINSINLEGVK